MNLKLKEKLAIVTGSHGSIGQAICLKLNQIMVSMRNLHKCTRMVII